jgi:hypothetical protein
MAAEQPNAGARPAAQGAPRRPPPPPNPDSQILVDRRSLTLARVGMNETLEEVQAAMEGIRIYRGIRGVNITVEEISSSGQDRDAWKQAMLQAGVKKPVGSPKDTEMGGAEELFGRAAGGQMPATRRVILRLEGDEESVQIGRQEIINTARRLREDFNWIIGDNLTAAGRAARRTASAAFRQLLQGGFRPRWRDGIQIVVLPPGERFPRPHTEADLLQCRGESGQDGREGGHAGPGQGPVVGTPSRQGAARSEGPHP